MDNQNQEPKKSNLLKKGIFFVIGGFLILGTLVGGNLKYIIDWSSSELVGYNIWSIVAICGGGYLIYLAAKK